jgi:hypothetical protein
VRQWRLRPMSNVQDIRTVCFQMTGLAQILRRYRIAILHNHHPRRRERPRTHYQCCQQVQLHQVAESFLLGGNSDIHLKGDRTLLITTRVRQPGLIPAVNNTLGCMEDKLVIMASKHSLYHNSVLYLAGGKCV